MASNLATKSDLIERASQIYSELHNLLLDVVEAKVSLNVERLTTKALWSVQDIILEMTTVSVQNETKPVERNRQELKQTSLKADEQRATVVGTTVKPVCKNFVSTKDFPERQAQAKHTSSRHSNQAATCKSTINEVADDLSITFDQDQSLMEEPPKVQIENPEPSNPNVHHDGQHYWIRVPPNLLGNAKETTCPPANPRTGLKSRVGFENKSGNDLRSSKSSQRQKPPGELSKKVSVTFADLPEKILKSNGSSSAQQTDNNRELIKTAIRERKKFVLEGNQVVVYDQDEQPHSGICLTDKQTEKRVVVHATPQKRH